MSWRLSFTASVGFPRLPLDDQDRVLGRSDRGKQPIRAEMRCVTCMPLLVEKWGLSIKEFTRFPVAFRGCDSDPISRSTISTNFLSFSSFLVARFGVYWFQAR